MKLLIIFLFCGIFGFSSSARILGIIHIPTKSHFIIGESLMRGLAAKGHDVTFASPIKVKEEIPNMRNIYLEGVEEIGAKYSKLMFNGTTFSSFMKMSNFTSALSDATLRAPSMLKLLNSGEKFDAVIVEPFGADAFFGFGYLFNAHVILLNTAVTILTDNQAGNVAPYSFVPHSMTTYSDHMTFFQRLANTFAHISFQIIFNFLGSTQKTLYEEFFPGAPDISEAFKNASLFLINSNIIFETPRPYLPNMIQIGGLHIKEPKKLPKDLQEYLDNAKEGVILFSFGSNLKSADLSSDKREIILKTFRKLSQKVLWKFEDENLPGKPDNVKIGKWLPQSDILAHPNVKLFITHGGLLSSTESMYRGVPILGIPVYADQHSNVATFVNAGYGHSLSLDELSEEKFFEKITEVLKNPTYSKNIKRDSNILTDQPMKPLDRAVYWVEYVIRHNGAKHLRSASLDLSLYQYLLLDVIAFLIFVLGTFLIGIYLSIKTVCNYFKSNTADVKKVKKIKRRKTD